MIIILNNNDDNAYTTTNSNRGKMTPTILELLPVPILRLVLDTRRCWVGSAPPLPVLEDVLLPPHSDIWNSSL